MTDIASVRFTPGVAEKLGFYVYRLIDPRDGATFYVGKGQGERLLAHVRGALTIEPEAEAMPAKIERIHAIRSAGLEVGHVIHRHGLSSKEACQVEAALIQAYPDLTNIAGGHHSFDRGVSTLQQIIEVFEARPIVPQHRLMAIIVNLSFRQGSRSPYDATRFDWKVSLHRVQKIEFVLAVSGGLVRKVYQPTRWAESNAKNFPGLTTERSSKRKAFDGVEAPEAVRKLYVGTRLPPRPRGAISPIIYLDPHISN
ncbi:MAG: hypothetical protein JNK84_12330 [Phreatobacter sp.]|uniref:LEM-3-like GIY-YIG domain-containing protein n=1 Tax=Phreatobacter sp. TaxID=1966341 RepID=UPI001A3802E5|nr:hypothetical protein [Phreatobacter sp.]MBL8569853.1 hypothetical protein [Phreatobacter sp.]